MIVTLRGLGCTRGAALHLCTGYRQLPVTVMYGILAATISGEQTDSIPKGFKAETPPVVEQPQTGRQHKYIQRANYVSHPAAVERRTVTLS